MKHYKNALPNRCDFLFRLRASCVFITCVFTDLLMLKSLFVKLFVFMIYIHSSYCLFDNCVFCDLPRPSPINFPKIFLLKLGHEDKIIFRLKNYSFNTLLFFGLYRKLPVFTEEPDWNAHENRKIYTFIHVFACSALYISFSF